MGSVLLVTIVQVIESIRLFVRLQKVGNEIPHRRPEESENSNQKAPERKILIELLVDLGCWLSVTGITMSTILYQIFMRLA